MKIRAKRTGSGYRSQFEEAVAQDLESKGAAFSYEVDRVAYYKEYIPDFVLDNGIIIEAKGYLEDSDRTKHLLIKRQRPDLDIRFVFQNPRCRLSKKSKTTYAGWAKKHGFKWAEKEVPKEWINE